MGSTEAKCNGAATLRCRNRTGDAASTGSAHTEKFLLPTPERSDEEHRGDGGRVWCPDGTCVPMWPPLSWCRPPSTTCLAPDHHRCSPPQCLRCRQLHSRQHGAQHVDKAEEGTHQRFGQKISGVAPLHPREIAGPLHPYVWGNCLDFASASWKTGTSPVWRLLFSFLQLFSGFWRFAYVVEWFKGDKHIAVIRLGFKFTDYSARFNMYI
jgi:hypothetical protein